MKGSQMYGNTFSRHRNTDVLSRSYSDNKESKHSPSRPAEPPCPVHDRPDTGSFSGGVGSSSRACDETCHSRPRRFDHDLLRTAQSIQLFVTTKESFPVPAPCLKEATILFYNAEGPVRPLPSWAMPERLTSETGALPY